MKKQFLALLCIFAMNSIVIADDLETYLKGKDAEVDSASNLKNEARAVKSFRKAAEQGDAKAQYNLGIAYAMGEGILKDETQSVVWFRKAAEQGLADAQYNLGVAYAEGKGITKDDTQAVAWFRKAAEQGDSGAQANLRQLSK